MVRVRIELRSDVKEKDGPFWRRWPWHSGGCVVQEKEFGAMPTFEELESWAKGLLRFGGREQDFALWLGDEVLTDENCNRVLSNQADVVRLRLCSATLQPAGETPKSSKRSLVESQDAVNFPFSCKQARIMPVTGQMENVDDQGQSVRELRKAWIRRLGSETKVEHVEHSPPCAKQKSDPSHGAHELQMQRPHSGQGASEMQEHIIELQKRLANHGAALARLRETNRMLHEPLDAATVIPYSIHWDRVLDDWLQRQGLKHREALEQVFAICNDGSSMDLSSNGPPQQFPLLVVVRGSGAEEAANAVTSGDHLELDAFGREACSIANIGHAQPVQDLLGEFRFNANMVKQFEDLVQKHCIEGYIPVRGDGNCYYRAVIFAWLQHSIALGALTELRRLRIMLRKLGGRDHRCRRAANFFCHQLHTWISARESATSEAEVGVLLEQLQAAFNNASRVDMAAVLCLRHLVAAHLQSHADDVLSNDLTYARWASSVFGTSLEKHCQDVVLQMGAEATDLIQDSCPQVLGVRIHIYMVSRDASNVYEPQTSGVHGSKVHVHLLFKRGHYDVLIPRGTTVGMLLSEKLSQPRQVMEMKWMELHGIARDLRDNFLQLVGALDEDWAKHLQTLHRRGLLGNELGGIQALNSRCMEIRKIITGLHRVPQDCPWRADATAIVPQSFPMPAVGELVMPALDMLQQKVKQGRTCGLCRASETPQAQLRTLEDGSAAHLGCLKEHWEQHAVDRDSLFCIPPFNRTRIRGTAKVEPQSIRLSLSDIEDIVGSEDFASRLCALSLQCNKPPSASAVFYCSICLMNHDMDTAVTLPCEHRFCLASLRQAFEAGMERLHLDGLKCPMPQCNCDLTSNMDYIPTLKACLSAEAYSRVMDWLAVHNSNIYHCRHPGCKESVFLETEDDFRDLRCMKGHRFCGKCTFGPHLGYSCEQREAEESAQERRGHMAQGWRPCPRRCQHGGGYKNSNDCDHVTCLCGFEFCFECGVERMLPLQHDTRWHKPSCKYHPKERVTAAPKHEPRCPECQKLPEGTCCPFPQDDGYPESFVAPRTGELPARPSARRVCALEGINACGPHDAGDIYVIGGGAAEGDSGTECTNPQHAYCLDCAWGSIRGQIAAGLVPACPGSEHPNIHRHVGGCGGCSHQVTDEGQCGTSGCRACNRSLLTQSQVEQIMNHYFDAHPEEPTNQTVQELGLEHGMLTYSSGSQLVEGWTSQRMKRAFLRHAQMQGGGNLVYCPGGHDVGLTAAGEDQTRFRCPHLGCEWQNKEFCSLCNQTFHFHADCQEILAIEAEWNRWCRQGRQAYLDAVALANNEFRQLREDFQERRAQHEQDVQLREQVVERMRLDEQWKARRCKNCPHCGRVVQRLSGCDSMVCGQDNYGGNIQAGCGRSFLFSTAPAYEPHQHELPAMARFDAQPPEQIQQISQMLCEGVERCCDLCSDPIKGPAIQCMNCPDFTVCTACDAKNDIMAQTQSTNGEQRHPAGHLFQVRLTAVHSL